MCYTVCVHYELPVSPTLFGKDRPRNDRMKTRYLTNARASIVLFAALFTTFSFISMTKQCFSSAMAFIKADALYGEATATRVGAIVAVFYLVYGVLQTVGGIVTDKWKPEHFITFGFVGAGICNLLVYYFYANYTAVLIIWVLNGISQFAVWPATFKLISGTLKQEQRATAIFLICLATPIGTVVNYAVAALIPRWQYNFLLSAIGLLVLGVAWEIVIRCVRPYFIVEEVEAPDVPEHTHYHEEQPHIPTLALLFFSGMIFFLAVNLIRAVFDNGLKTLVAYMIDDAYSDISTKISTALSIIILVFGSLGAFLGRLIYPHLIKNEIHAVMLMFVPCVPLVCGMLLIGRIHYWAIVVLLSLLVLLMNSCGLFGSYMTARFNKWGKSATVAGVMNTMSSLGIVVSNFVFPRVHEHFEGTGNWTICIRIWIGLLVFAILLLLVIAPMWKRFLRDKYYH